jgi:hypothetical protein
MRCRVPGDARRSVKRIDAMLEERGRARCDSVPLREGVCVSAPRPPVPEPIPSALQARAKVLVQGEDLTFQVEWTFGNDPSRLWEGSRRRLASSRGTALSLSGAVRPSLDIPARRFIVSRAQPARTRRRNSSGNAWGM